jgi:nucleoside-diphosphate-sugar epimerase
MRIVIAGASGFIGKELINILKNHHEVIGISRYARANEQNVKWVQCDLFSLIDIENTLAEADVAVYLVHSMLPSARLTQGSFRDFDMILADNFSRAAKKAKIKKIVYLSGIIPPDAILSEHLQSRLEVENILKTSGIPTSSLRAGLIIGPGGSSFEMMLRLVERLPIMICPYWTSTLSYPISVWDAVEIIKNRIENMDLKEHECLDICGPDALSYEEMMKALSIKLNRKHFFLPVPFVSPRLSKLWVRLITGAPKDLVYPLVDSLKNTYDSYFF